ncbi:MAG: glycosyltransferase family 4 protein [Anaerolineaceae bacterium]|nr:glycosyltransferase family 4 protein [Anaerolineaceae bacterium]
MQPKLGYIVSRFPHLPETFILREMVELGRLGWSISLYPLISQQQAVMHQDAADWARRAKKTAFFAPAVWLSNTKFLFRSPTSYFKTWINTMRFNFSSPKMLSRALILFPKAVWMADKMKQEGIGHIHAHYATHPALAAWIIHQLTGISYSITIHAHDIFVNRTMLPQKIQDAAFVVAISEFNRQFISHEIGEWVRPKTHVIHCGISPELYIPQKENGRRADGSTFKLVTIGSLQPYKGQEVLIHACARLIERGIPLQCDIIGEGVLRLKLERLIQELGLTAKVNLLGAMTQEEIARRLPAADCYVQPSVITPSGKMEGIPLALMEAMACSLPVVASNLSGIPELVIPGETGFLVPTGDDKALADQLANIYSEPDAARQIALGGQKTVQQRFDLSSQVCLLASLFEALT